MRKRTYRSADGTENIIPDWQVRLQVGCREAWFNLGTTNKTTAAIKARDIYVSLKANGWESTLEKFKPETAKKTKIPTVGEFLAAVESHAGIKKGTLGIYKRKFRTLVAGAFGISGDLSKHDHTGAGYRAWLERVHAVRLDKLTPERVQRWRVAYIRKAEGNPLQEKRARVTVNSILRNSKSLFSERKILRHMRSVPLPSPLPLAGVELDTVRPGRYKSEISADLLITAARNELAQEQPEAFKIFMLALGAGLRRDEIDSLLWDQVNWEAARIKVETNAHTAAKSDDSEGEIDVDPDLLDMLRTYKAGSRSKFVIESRVAPRPGATWHHYRAQRHFDALVKWLRGKGVTARNAIHSLRKEFGSIICQQGGIHIASRQLRHADIRITSQTYADKRERVVVKMGLPKGPHIVPPAESAQA